MGDLGQDHGGEVAGSRGCRDGVFGEDGVFIGNARVEERCCWSG